MISDHYKALYLLAQEHFDMPGKNTCIMECVRKSDGKEVVCLCVIRRLPGEEGVEICPIAEMIDPSVTHPCEQYDPPEPSLDLERN